ncbi:MAG TPA: hypothetical protein VKU02_02245 [Gemmataceae bacterium]|nr:hypothetical protein [Gemmataceae bacterium]
MPNVAAAAAHIKLAVAPVVFLDTCVLLDVVRAPLRNAAGNVEAATELLTRATRNPPAVYLVVACPTPTEWGAHIDEAVQDCENAVNSVGAVSASCTFVGLPALGPLPAGLATLPDRLKTLSKNLLDESILLDKDGDALSRAIDRIINARKPARKGGQGAKDAAILEHAVSLVDALLVGGFAGLRVFVSSNTDDFATAKTTAIHPDIRLDFDPPRDIHYFVSLSAAVTWLKARAWVP